MPPRPEPSPIPLPFDATPLLPAPPLATGFISYSHDTPAHVQRVQRLAAQLEAAGVHCEIDDSQTSPPQGWPLWMLQQIEKSAFVLVVCTETYARRFTGRETPGKGKGATWEGKLITQSLYESAENRRFIPVIFGRHDTEYIPLVLKGATHYDVSTPEGYRALHHALTNPDAITRPLPDLPATDATPPNSPPSDVTALLHLCPDPLPLLVIARAVGQDPAQLAQRLRRLRSAVADVFTDSIQLPADFLDHNSAPSPHALALALQAELDFIDNHPNATGRTQLRNVLALADAADLLAASAQVSRTFRTIQTMLKALGDKHLLLRTARRSIAASRAEGRGREQAKDEAIAAICGVSWVYQRTGRLSEALAEAERSLALGRAIHWDRNTAFCLKCIGRLRRMQSETCPDAQERAKFLRASESSLSEAIEQFLRLDMVAEVGDCYGLLARTYLVMGDRGAARAAVAQAESRLVDSADKDYLDLQIVKGDLALRDDPEVAESLYTEVLATTRETGDAQRSEIIARAHLQRGRARAILRQEKRAMVDFRSAASIWDHLKDPAADTAHWEIERVASWMDGKTERRLMAEAVSVRVCAARIIVDETSRRPAGRSQRRTLTEEYLRGVIKRARERVVVGRPAW